MDQYWDLDRVCVPGSEYVGQFCFWREFRNTRIRTTDHSHGILCPEIGARKLRGSQIIDHFYEYISILSMRKNQNG